MLKKLIKKYGADHIIIDIYHKIKHDENALKYLKNIKDITCITSRGYNKFNIYSNDIHNKFLTIFINEYGDAIFHEKDI